MTTPPTEEERVAAGFAFLTERLGPGWFWDINLDGLDLKSACQCVLGQLSVDYGDNWSAICDKFGITLYGPAGDRPNAYDLGFNAIRVPRTSDATLAEARAEEHAFASLTTAWRKAILTARAAGPGTAE